MELPVRTCTRRTTNRPLIHSTQITRSPPRDPTSDRHHIQKIHPNTSTQKNKRRGLLIVEHLALHSSLCCHLLRSSCLSSVHPRKDFDIGLVRLRVAHDHDKIHQFTASLFPPAGPGFHALHKAAVGQHIHRSGNNSIFHPFGSCQWRKTKTKIFSTSARPK